MQMCKANIYPTPVFVSLEEDAAKKLKKKLFGYLEAWNELMEQGVQEKFDDLVVACGSGGTISGLAIGNYLTGRQV